MKQFYLVTILFFTISGILSAQQDIDVAPILADCYTAGDVTMEMVNCSEDKLRSLIYESINQEVCPEADTSRFYRLNFTVDKKGKAKFIAIINDKADKDCMGILENRVKAFFKSNKFEPAEKDGKSVQFTRSIGFNFPIQELVEDVSSPFQIVEAMPRFVGCESIMGVGSDKEDCAKRQLLQFIYANLKYPKTARENGIQGMCVVQFIIDETGNVHEEKIVRDIGGDCGDAVLDMMEEMKKLDPPFVPGIQFGKKVKVKYTLPVSFTLEKKKKKKR